MTLTLHHGDCLELMKTLPDKSIDLFVCDLPYGCLEPQRTRSPEYVKSVKNSGVGQGSCAWDIPIDLAAFWVQVKRLCKDDHTPVLMFCTTKFGYELIKSNEDWFRYDLVWSKTKAVGFLLANKMPIRSHEMIYVFSKKGATYTRIDYVGDFPAYVGSHSSAKVYDLPKPDKEGYKKVEGGKRCPTSIVQVKTLTNKGKHPTQKPDDLYEWLITRYSKEGDTILDPTAGSFASCFTAKRLGRNAIGIEKDQAFYDKAKSLAVI
jgi:site-specific DNA-methyltransferase (adenine-specific)